jgi:Flp pilus assembly protein TadD
MRRSRQSRSSGRQQGLGDLFPPGALEGEPVPQGPDGSFPLRPFADEIPHDAGVDPHVEAAETPVERLLRLGREAGRTGRRGDALAAFQQLLELHPEHLAARLELAALHERHGDLDNALTELGEAVRRLPDRAEPLIARGAFLARLKRHPEAEADLLRAIKLAPELPDAHFELGFALWRKGLAADASAPLRRAIALDPERAAAHHYLGESLHQLGDDPGALVALERAAALEPGNPKPLQLMGRVLDQLGRPDEAREMYRRAREAGPR